MPERRMRQMGFHEIPFPVNWPRPSLILPLPHPEIVKREFDDLDPLSFTFFYFLQTFEKEDVIARAPSYEVLPPEDILAHREHLVFARRVRARWGTFGLSEEKGALIRRYEYADPIYQELFTDIPPDLEPSIVEHDYDYIDIVHSAKHFNIESAAGVVGFSKRDFKHKEMIEEAVREAIAHPKHAERVLQIGVDYWKVPTPTTDHTNP